MQTQTPTNLLCRESPPGTAALRQREQRHTEARPDPKAPIPPENKALHSRLWAQAAVHPAFASAQGDETMQANVKHRSTGKLLSRLSWPLHCQVQSSALPARISSPFPAGEGSALVPKSQGDGTSGNHSQRIRHRQLLGTGMVSPTYAYAAPSSHQGAVDNYHNTRDKRIHA